MANQLTKRQAVILAFVRRYIAEHSFPPCIREIGFAFRIAGSSVYDHLEALERKGYIRRSARRSRSIEIIKKPTAVTEQVAGIPIIGRIAAGQPLLAEQNVEGHLAVDADSQGGAPLYALRVVGDSMVGAGIFSGDFVIARYQENANEGDIVVARLDNEATVKRLKRNGPIWRLQPENDAYKPISISSEGVRIQGKVIAVHRILA